MIAEFLAIAVILLLIPAAIMANIKNRNLMLASASNSSSGDPELPEGTIHPIGHANKPMNDRSFYLFLKRFSDIAFSLIGLGVLGIPMIIIAIIIKADSKGPVFFKQERIGKNEVPFKCMKFRTMRTDAPKDCPPYMFENPEVFITGIGKVLRKSSLDEVPQFFNILKGEMSIVGPRPCTASEKTLIRKRRQGKVFSVKPGLTGWAQVNGRDEIQIKKKVLLDSYYIRNACIRFDAEILWLTFIKVIKQDGVHEGINEKNKIR